MGSKKSSRELPSGGEAFNSSRESQNNRQNNNNTGGGSYNDSGRRGRGQGGGNHDYRRDQGNYRGGGGGSNHNNLNRSGPRHSTFKKFSGTPKNHYVNRMDSDLSNHSKFYGQFNSFHASPAIQRFSDNDKCDTDNQQKSNETVPQKEPVAAAPTPTPAAPTQTPAAPTPTPSVQKTATNMTPKIKSEIAKSQKAATESSSSSSSSDSEDSVLKSLKKVIDTSIVQPGKIAATNQKKPAANVKKEPESKSDKSSSSTSSSSDDSTSSEDDAADPKQASEEDVVCLGNLEKFENLVEDDEPASVITNCLLCDKSGHIAFHCQMICKNCNGKYHGLKDCPKPANLSVVLSSFMQFCLKQSYKYNPNLGFAADGSEQYMPPTPILEPGNAPISDCVPNAKRKKSRSETSKYTRKRVNSSPTSSTDSDSEATSSHRKRHRNSSKSGQGSMQPFASAVPFPTAFNPAFGFNSTGVVNPLLALSQMMGYSPAAMGFPMHAAKD